MDTKGPFQIIVDLPDAEAQKARERGLQPAIGNYFDYRTGMLERDLRDLFRIGRRSLVIGIGVLTICLALSQLVRTALLQWGPGPTPG